jgi:hypothetical protein
MAEDSKPVKILGGVPAVSSDGHGIGINPENGDTNLLFIQMVPKQSPSSKDTELDEPEANVVSNIRLNIEQLKQLNKAISDTINDYESSKK